MIELNQIINGDCLEVMKEIESKSIDMILCDLPYGTTACKWDVVIPFELLWEQYKRIIKDNGAIVLTASQPFTTDLINSNRKWFKYEWIWDKKRVTGHINCNRNPLKLHENILIFYDNLPKYNPQRTRKNTIGLMSESVVSNIRVYNVMRAKSYNDNENGFPKSIISHIPVMNNLTKDKSGLHPTQKPIALFEYLIRTYTNENETVLDNCSGSGTTAMACIRTDRNYICIEKDKDYYDASVKRINKELLKIKMF